MLRFHRCPHEFVSTPGEGVLAFDESRNVIAERIASRRVETPRLSQPRGTVRPTHRGGARYDPGSVDAVLSWRRTVSGRTACRTTRFWPASLVCISTGAGGRRCAASAGISGAASADCTARCEPCRRVCLWPMTPWRAASKELPAAMCATPRATFTITAESAALRRALEGVPLESSDADSRTSALKPAAPYTEKCIDTESRVTKLAGGAPTR